MNLKVLVGSGENIGLFVLPFLIIGLGLNVLFPSFFSVGGPPPLVAAVSIIVLIPGIINWIWSVALILTRIPKKQLITTGPYAVVKHPLYTGVALLVIPWVGFLLNSWLGLLIGAIVYIGSRRYAPEEEAVLSQVFGHAWDNYVKQVKIPWL